MQNASGRLLWLGFSPHPVSHGSASILEYIYASQTNPFIVLLYLMPYLVRSFPENYSCDTLFQSPVENCRITVKLWKELERNVIEYAFWAVHSTLKGLMHGNLEWTPHTRAVCNGVGHGQRGWKYARPCGGRVLLLHCAPPPGPPCTSLLLLPH